MSALDEVTALVVRSLSPDSLQPASDLPATFPDVETPRFLYGDRLQWISNRETTDWGITIGRFYSFAPHSGCWQWRYLIWLDSDSPSSGWVKADLAWEEDLQAFAPISAAQIESEVQ